MKRYTPPGHTRTIDAFNAFNSRPRELDPAFAAGATRPGYIRNIFDPVEAVAAQLEGAPA